MEQHLRPQTALYLNGQLAMMRKRGAYNVRKSDQF